MSTARLAAYEFKRFKGPLPKIALAFLAIVPLMYGALYLWSNWEPYQRLDQVPVAVVNEDVAVEVDGRSIDAGAQFVAELQADPIFQWHFTDAADAADGLANGRYYLTITVPQDFSANLASGAGDDPRRAVLQLHRDDVNGYVIGLMTSTVQDKLTAAIDRAAEEEYFTAMFANLREIRSGMKDAAEGAAQLSDGITDAHTGATKLATGLDAASEGADSLESGLTSAKKGSAKLAAAAPTAAKGAADLATGLDAAKTGSATLADGIDQLKAGADELAPGADQVAAGNRQIADVVVPVLDAVIPILPEITAANAQVTEAVANLTGQVSGDQDSLSARAAAADAALDALVAANPELADDPAVVALQQANDAVTARVGDLATAAGDVSTATDRIAEVAAAIDTNVPDATQRLTDASTQLTQLADGSEQVAQGVHQLADNLGTAQSGASDLADGVAAADDGAHDLADGLSTLSTGITDLDAGLAKLVTGSTDLAKGIASADKGAHSLDDGLAKADTGAQELADKLAAGAARIPALSGEDEDEAVQVLSQPADVQMTIDNPAGVYGRGLAPFFFAIAIWVFGISVFLVIRPTTPRALAGHASAVRIALAGWLPVVGLGTLGALLLFFVAWFALGLNPVHAALSALVVILATACFTAIAHLLRNAFGMVGSAITLVLLMVQLTSCGGLYPVETLPLPFRVLHPLMPMTYLVDALRITFTGGPIPRLWLDVAVMAGFALVSAALGVFVVARRKRFRFDDLHPQLADS